MGCGTSRGVVWAIERLIGADDLDRSARGSDEVIGGLGEWMCIRGK